MNKRHFFIGVTLFFGVLLILQGCSRKKTYTMSEQGENTASLTVPNFVQVGSFDGDSVENMISRIIYEGKRELTFPAGEHVVEIRYNDIWDIDDYDHEKIISDYITLRFQAKRGGRYKLNVKAPEDRSGAHELAANFTAAIIDAQTGQRVSR